MRITATIATLMLIGAAAAHAQQPAGACNPSFDDTATTRVRSVKLPSGEYNTFTGGRVIVHCTNQPGVRIEADSAEYDDQQGVLNLIGHVQYTGPRAVIDTHGATSFDETKRPTEGDPLAAYLFPPELIMAHQQELGLQDDQRSKIISEIAKAQAKFVELQWTMNAETERLQTLLEPAVADEGQVLAQVDRTLAVEREIKRLQITLLVRIKNTLTATQQAKLAALRKARTPSGMISPEGATTNPRAGPKLRLGNIF